MSKIKSAMQELIDFLELELKIHDFLQLPAYEKAKELLEKEKQQIIEAYQTNIKTYIDEDGNLNTNSAEQYYNETFNK